MLGIIRKNNLMGRFEDFESAKLEIRNKHLE